MITFLKLVSLSENDGIIRKGFVTLGDQMLSKRTPIKENLLVKARKGSESLFQRERSHGLVGSFYWTESLRPCSGCYEASDVQPVSTLKEENRKDPAKRLCWELWRLRNIPDFPSGRDYPDGFKCDLIRSLASYFNLDSPVSVEAYRQCGILPESLSFPRGTVTAMGFDYRLHDTDGRLNPHETVTVTTRNAAGEERTEELSLFARETAGTGAVLDVIYRALVRIIAEISRTGCVMTPQDSRLIDVKGVSEVHVAVCWPEVQDLFGMKGFRRHSLLMEGEDYRVFGDSAYWVSYRWLFPEKKQTKYTI